MKPERMDYYGFTHLPIPHFLYGLWRRIFCKRHIHLFDECLSSAGGKPEDGGWSHYLVCDVCQLMVHIDSVDQTYVKDKRKGYYEEYGYRKDAEKN